MNTHRFALMAALALGAASPAMAQQHQHPATPAQAPDMAAMHCGGGMVAMMHGMPPGQRGMPGMRADSMMHVMPGMRAEGMMAMMGPPTPAMILNHKGQLGLSAEQASRLEALEKEAEPVCSQHMRLGMTTHQTANQLLEAAEPDFSAYASQLKQATAHMVEGHVVMARAAVAARDVLTAAQRQTLKNVMEQMHKRP